MEEGMKILREIGWPLTVLAFFVVVLSIILIREIHANMYRYRSTPHDIQVDLGDNLGWAEMRAIQRNLQSQTYQPVSGCLVDRHKKIFRVRVMCPPDKFPGLIQWLRSRRWVEHAEH
jgi:hypothetical protein